MNISSILPCVNRPSRYLGTEINTYHRSWGDTELHSVLVFPDLYEIGMSHLGLHILYHILNNLEGSLADRAYCPDTDMEALMRKKGISAWGLESRKPLSEFDIIAFTLPYELCYVNILTLLDLAGIPFFSRERTGRDIPLILGGGGCALNPEPVADFFDAILLGDGEEAIVQIAECVREWKGHAHASRQELLEALARIEGIYIPSFYRSLPDASGFDVSEPIHPLAGDVRRRIVSKLHEIPFPPKPLVPYMQIVHDRLGLEIARGCTRGCRFCQAGIIYRPVRERPVEQILDMAVQGLEATGWDELSLLSLSTGDYSSLFPLIHELMLKQREEHVSISLPSLRVGTLTHGIMQEIKSVRKTGFTLAPEAGTHRLRQVINKGITEQDLLETAALAFHHGWSHMKLYFMIGLPTETPEDVKAIADLARKVREQAFLKKNRVSRGKKQVTISIGTFVPKPHTPFQWEAQITESESRTRINGLRQALKGKSFNVKWHDPMQSFLEGIFSRGDRRLSKIIVRAWQSGARLDAWTDNMRPDLYVRAAGDEDIALDAYLGPRNVDARLPWDHLSSGIDTDYIRQQRENAYREIYTPDCRDGKCHKCGACDFKEIKPVVFREYECPADTAEKTDMDQKNDAQDKSERNRPSVPADIARHFCRIRYSKTGSARFLGHLEMVHAFHRAAKRAGIPVAYSSGFHPMPRVAFGQPLSLGMESLREEAVMELTMHMEAELILKHLNHELPMGLSVSEVLLSGNKIRIPEPELTRYLIWLPGRSGEKNIRAGLAAFHDAETVPVERERKGRKIILDAKKQVNSLQSVSMESDISRPDLAMAEKAWLENRQRETGVGYGSLLILEMLKREGPGLKPHEIAAAATDCCKGFKAMELLEIMHILKTETGRS